MKLPILATLSALALASMAHGGVIVIGSLARSNTARPGEAFEGVILLKNTDRQSAEALVSQTDYHTAADGSTQYGEPGKLPRSNASWLTLTPTRVRLSPGESVPVRYKGRVPADTKLIGSYWSMVMVEPTTPPAITPEGKVDQVSVGLRTTIRFGVQIVTEIGQSGERSLKIESKRLARQDGQRSLELAIANDGQRLLIPQMTVELFDAKGTSIGRFDGGRSRIYPDCSSRMKVDLTDVPVGRYTAMVLLDSGDAQVMGAQYDLEVTP